MRPELPDALRLGPRSGARPRQLVVVLHGYGADGNDLLPLAEAWRDSLPEAAFLIPHAPGLHPAGFGREWFPLTFADPTEVRRGVLAAAPALHRQLDAELEALGVAESATALTGFSQGAMMALAAGLTRRAPVAGILSYSGLVDWPVPAAGPEPPPVFLYHGSEDTIVPAAALPVTREALERAGYTVEAHLQPGLAHGIDSAGLARGAHFLERVLNSHRR